VAEGRHRDSMSGIRFPAITGYFSHYCQKRSQKLPRIITDEVWERTEPYLNTFYRPCIITQTKPVVLLRTQKVPRFKLAAASRSLQWTSSFSSNASMAPKIRPASLVYTPSKTSVTNYPTIRCYRQLLAASL